MFTAFLTMGRKAQNDQNKNECYWLLPSMYLHRKRHTARNKNNKADKIEYTGLVCTGV